MKVQINFKIINPDYNQDYANEYNGGKEGESNWKYLQVVTLGIDNVVKTSVIEDENFTLNGSFEGKEEFEWQIPNVLIFRCHLQSEQFEDFGVSKSVLNKTHQAKKEGYEVLRFYFYMNTKPESIRIGQRLFIDVRNIPHEMLALPNPD